MQHNRIDPFQAPLLAPVLPRRESLMTKTFVWSGGGWRRALTVACAALLACIASGCAGVPTDYDKPQSSALADPRSTQAGIYVEKLAAEHPGQSGFAILRYGRNAFNMRIMMADLAEKTLDVQVYIWEVDKTGLIFAERVLRAADRGVRVRLLVDDLGLQATDEGVAALDAHPNIEVRIFNPFAHRGSKALDFLFDLDRVNNRMHNKTMIMDNAMAVVGGRNMGDHYFGVNTDTNFRDLDIGAIGPIVRDISGVFDYFWQGDWAVPIAALVDAPPSVDDVRAEYADLRAQVEASDYPYDIERDQEGLLAELADTTGLYTWAQGQIVWDDPARIEELEQTANAGRIASSFFNKAQTVEHSLDIESAYFVPGRPAVAATREMVERGVSIRVLTNSLVSNDVLAAHAGHAMYRKEMLESGVELYELRPDSRVIKKTWVGRSRAGLHTKAMVFDEEAVFIGSYNLDPRSADLNTEAGLYVESEALAAQLLEYMAVGRLPENAYRVVLEGDGDLAWITSDDGVEVRYDRDPHSTWSERFMTWFIGILPIRSQL